MKVLCAWHPQAAPRSRAWRPPRAQPQRRQCLPESEGDEGAAPLEPAEGPSRTRVCDDCTETALLPGSDQSTCLLILLTWSKTQAKGHCRGQTLAGTGATCRPGTPTLNARPPGSRRPERRRFSATVPAAAPPRERAPEAFWPLHEAVTNTCRHGRPPVSTVRPKPSEPRRPGPQGARRGRPDCSPVTEKSCALIAALCLYFATTPRDNVRRPLRSAWLENSQPGGCVLLPDNLHLGVPSPNHLLKETLPLNL